MAPSADWHAPHVLFVNSSHSTTLSTSSGAPARLSVTGSSFAGTGMLAKVDIRNRTQMSRTPKSFLVTISHTTISFSY